MKFRKKPIVIEAIQWNGTLAGIETIKVAFPDIETKALSKKHDVVYCWEIGTLEGRHVVSAGDYVIKGVKGEYYPCKPDIFAATYEPAETPKQEPAHDEVPMPQNADQAQLMALVAENWLKHNAPERLKEPAQAVEQPRAWPTGEIRLVDRADGCRGHYAIGRMHKSGYVEYWNLRANCWSSCSDDVLALEQAQALMYSMSPSVAPAKAVPLDDDTRKRVLELCTAAQEHVSVWTYPYGKQTLELAKQIRERLEAGE